MLLAMEVISMQQFKLYKLFCETKLQVKFLWKFWVNTMVFVKSCKKSSPDEMWGLSSSC